MFRHQLLQLGQSQLQPHVLDVEDHLAGGLGVAGAPGQAEVVILAGAGVVQRLQRRVAEPSRIGMPARWARITADPARGSENRPAA